MNINEENRYVINHPKDQLEGNPDGRRPKKEKRRSSILKMTKSPVRGLALDDIDPNIQNSEETTGKSSKSRRSTSRRVSFAETCQIKEIPKEVSKSTWTLDHEQLPNDENTSGPTLFDITNSSGDSPYRQPASTLAGLPSLMSSPIQDSPQKQRFPQGGERSPDIRDKATSLDFTQCVGAGFGASAVVDQMDITMNNAEGWIRKDQESSQPSDMSFIHAKTSKTRPGQPLQELEDTSVCQAYSDNQNPCTSTEMNSAFKVNGLAFLRRLDGNVSISTSNLPHVNSLASRSRTGRAVQEAKCSTLERDLSGVTYSHEESMKGVEDKTVVEDVTFDQMNITRNYGSWESGESPTCMTMTHLATPRVNNGQSLQTFENLTDETTSLDFTRCRGEKMEYEDLTSDQMELTANQGERTYQDENAGNIGSSVFSQPSLTAPRRALGEITVDKNAAAVEMKDDCRVRYVEKKENYSSKQNTGSEERLRSMKPLPSHEKVSYFKTDGSAFLRKLEGAKTSRGNTNVDRTLLVTDSQSGFINRGKIIGLKESSRLAEGENKRDAQALDQTLHSDCHDVEITRCLSNGGLERNGSEAGHQITHDVDCQDMELTRCASEAELVERNESKRGPQIPREVAYQDTEMNSYQMRVKEQERSEEEIEFRTFDQTPHLDCQDMHMNKRETIGDHEGDGESPAEAQTTAAEYCPDMEMTMKTTETRNQASHFDSEDMNMTSFLPNVMEERSESETASDAFNETLDCRCEDAEMVNCAAEILRHGRNEKCSMAMDQSMTNDCQHTARSENVQEGPSPSKKASLGVEVSAPNSRNVALTTSAPEQRRLGEWSIDITKFSKENTHAKDGVNLEVRKGSESGASCVKSDNTSNEASLQMPESNKVKRRNLERKGAVSSVQSDVLKADESTKRETPSLLANGSFLRPGSVVGESFIVHETIPKEILEDEVQAEGNNEMTVKQNELPVIEDEQGNAGMLNAFDVVRPQLVPGTKENLASEESARDQRMRKKDDEIKKEFDDDKDPDDVQTEEPYTLKDFLALSDVYFYSKFHLKKRSETPVTQPDVSTELKDLIFRRCLGEAKYQVLDNFSKQIQADINLNEKLFTEREQELNDENPAIFRELKRSLASEEENSEVKEKISSLKRACKYGALKDWYDRRTEMDKEVLHLLKEQEQNLVDDLSHLTSYEKELDDDIILLDKLSVEFDEKLQDLEMAVQAEEKKWDEYKKGNDRFHEKLQELESDVKIQEVEREKLAGENDNISREVADLKNNNMELERYIDHLEEMMRDAPNLQETKKELKFIEGLQEWILEKHDATSMKFTFLCRTFDLDVSFEELEECSLQPSARTKHISLTSCLSDNSSPIAKLGHQLIKEAFSRCNFLEMFPSRHSLPQLLRLVSDAMAKVRALIEDVEFISISHIVSLKDKLLTIEFSSWRNFIKFELTFDLSKVVTDGAMQYKIVKKIGAISSDDIQKKLSHIPSTIICLSKLLKAADGILRCAN